MERISRNLYRNCDIKSSMTSIDGNLESNPENDDVTVDVALKNISNKLFDENIDVSPNESALLAIEKSFDDILKPNCPSLSHNNLQLSTFQNESFPILEFRRGMEEGMKFLPTIKYNCEVVNDFLQDNQVPLPSKSKKDRGFVERMLKEGEGQERDLVRLNGKRHTNCDNLSVAEGRKCRISVLYFKNQDDEMQSEIKPKIHESLVNLRTLLMHCSQKIALSDTQNANQLIKQIRKHSSPNGNAEQRMAHIFVNGLEARLNGTYDKAYRQFLMPPQETMPDLVFHIPLYKASQFYTIPIIINAIGKGSKLHVINLGREFDFHWPNLIQALSAVPGGPPNLRITNIETPTSDSLPTERIEVAERLERLSRRFGVSLEYRCMTTKWDEICIDDLNIEKDEVRIVNCLRGWEYLGDETDAMYSPRNQVLNIIRQISPHVFIQGIINGSFSSSFFADRFKQVLLHSCALFDFFDGTIPRDNKQRRFLENNLWGLVVFNVIACEGSQRFMRTETY